MTGKNDMNSNKTQPKEVAVTALAEALVLLGYSEDQPAHYKTNLVAAISLHAGATGQGDLEEACQSELARIRDKVIFG